MTESSTSDLNSKEVPSTKPYLIRALYDWCVDNGFTPYLAVFVDANVQVPMEYVKNDEIVLNISPTSSQGLAIDNDWISFKARFGGVPKEIMLPVSHVMAIYARENGQGMSFPVQIIQPPEPPKEKQEDAQAKRPHLRLVK